MCNSTYLITIMIVDGLSEFWKLTLSEDATLVQKPNPIHRRRYLNVTNTQLFFSELVTLESGLPLGTMECQSTHSPRC